MVPPVLRCNGGAHCIELSKHRCPSPDFRPVCYGLCNFGWFKKRRTTVLTLFWFWFDQHLARVYCESTALLAKGKRKQWHPRGKHQHVNIKRRSTGGIHVHTSRDTRGSVQGYSAVYNLRRQQHRVRDHKVKRYKSKIALQDSTIPIFNDHDHDHDHDHDS